MSLLKTRHELHLDDKYVFQQKNGLPFNPNNVYREIKFYAEKAGIPELTVHDLRHNYGTSLAEGNIHQRIIEKQMGHIDYRSSRRYLHPTQKAQSDAAATLNSFAEKILGCSTVAVQIEKTPKQEPESVDITGAGEGNRTLVTSLEG